MLLKSYCIFFLPSFHLIFSAIRDIKDEISQLRPEIQDQKTSVQVYKTKKRAKLFSYLLGPCEFCLIDLSVKFTNDFPVQIDY